MRPQEKINKLRLFLKVQFYFSTELKWILPITIALGNKHVSVQKEEQWNTIIDGRAENFMQEYKNN